MDFLLANGYVQGSQLSDASLQVATSYTHQGHILSSIDFFLHVAPCIKNWSLLHSN